MPYGVLVQFPIAAFIATLNDQFRVADNSPKDSFIASRDIVCGF
jgi:hypothetical protein